MTTIMSDLATVASESTVKNNLLGSVTPSPTSPNIEIETVKNQTPGHDGHSQSENGVIYTISDIAIICIDDTSLIISL